MAYRTLVLYPLEQKTHRLEPQEKLQEAVNLAQAVGADVVHAEIITLRTDNPKTLFGKGTVDRIKELITQHRATLVVVNASLTGTQQRNLEKVWSKAPSLGVNNEPDEDPDVADLQCEVVDRTGLILSIFAERAQTREGRLQVALADLLYQRSRLVRSWTHLERQRGAMGAVGGPGEKQLELDRRLLDDKIKRLKSDLSKVQRTRELQRKSRQKVPYPVVALVGYTNAGKSTLFNRLTGADVMVKDQVFATLDPTMRQLKLPDGQLIILSDTVGFISDIPTHLVAAFRATLEEVLEADILLHVVDRSSPSYRQQMEDVDKVLKSLGVPASTPCINVFNKIDKLPTPENEAVLTVKGTAVKNPLFKNTTEVSVSALTGQGIAKLTQSLAATLRLDHHSFSLELPLHATKEMAWLHAHAHVTSHRADDAAIHLEGTVSTKAAGQFYSLFSLSLLPLHDHNFSETLPSP